MDMFFSYFFSFLFSGTGGADSGELCGGGLEWARDPP
jgi:hypothetical protein